MTIDPTPLEESGENFWTKMTERERRLVLLMVGNFVLLGIALGVYLFHQSQTETEAEIEQYADTLDAVREFGPLYLRRKQAEESGGDEDAKRFTGELLSKNDLALTSFVATQASAVDIKIDNYDEDSLPLSSNKDSGPVITEKQLRIDIREADLEKLMRMLERIEKTREPVVIKRINLREVRNKPGQVRANITISTYVQKEREG